MASELELHIADYVVLVVLLLTSAAIGVYHGVFANRQRTSGEFFLANRSMHAFPVSVSFAVSVISAVTFLGITSLSYFNGMAYLPTILARIIGGIFTATVICPVFYNLKEASIYEYLERRFNRIVRYIAVIEHLILTLLILGVVVYAPALALNAVTGLSLFGSILAVGMVSTFYSTIGGIKAVVWNDLFQSILMLIGFLIVITVACVRSGGLGEVWARLMEGQRTTVVDFRIDPRISLSFWTTVVGGLFSMLIYAGTNQNQAQRYLTCKDLRSAKWAVFWGFTWIGVFEVISVLAGVTIYAFYHSCDPLSDGKISKPDQILPFFVLDVFGHFPGLPGLLLSSVLSASLSTISTAINGMTTITGEDVVKKIWTNIPEGRFIAIMKFVSVCYGFLFMLMAFVASVTGGLIIKLAQALAGSITGPVFGVFLLGILVPRGNSKGALLGMFIGTFLGVWLLIGSILYPTSSTPLPLSTESCTADIVNATAQSITMTGVHALADTTTVFLPPSTTDAETPPAAITMFYGISFLYFGVLSSVATFLTGLAVGFIFPSERKIESELLSPVLLSVYDNLPESWQRKMAVKKEDNTNNQENGLTDANDTKL